MKSFLPLLFCGAVLLLANTAHAKDKPLETSKDNFVSLQWMRSGGFAGISEQYTIQNHEIIKPSRSSSYSPPQVAPLSENQWKELIEQLKKANVPAIVGNYKQEGLFDGFNETLVLTLSDSGNLDQTFTLNNYGNKAPASYRKFAAYLSTLLSRKFAPSTKPQTPIQTAPSPK